MRHMTYEFNVSFIDFKESGEDTYDVEVTVTTTIDPNYGADADGSRGEYREEINSIEIVEAMLNGRSLMLKDIPEQVHEDIIMRATDKFNHREMTL